MGKKDELLKKFNDAKKNLISIKTKYYILKLTNNIIINEDNLCIINDNNIRVNENTNLTKKKQLILKYINLYNTAYINIEKSLDKLLNDIHNTKIIKKSPSVSPANIVKNPIYMYSLLDNQFIYKFDNFENIQKKIPEFKASSIKNCFNNNKQLTECLYNHFIWKIDTDISNKLIELNDLDNEIWYKFDDNIIYNNIERNVKGIWVSNKNRYSYDGIKKKTVPNSNTYFNIHHCYEKNDNDSYKYTNIYYHILILYKFHGPQPSIKYEAQHIDKNVNNNYPENLKWGLINSNVNLSNKKSNSITVLQYDLNNNFINIFNSIKDAADNNKIDSKKISDCINNKIDSYKNFKFTKKDDPDLDNEVWLLNNTVNKFISNKGRILLQSGKCYGYFDKINNYYKFNNYFMHKLIVETFINDIPNNDVQYHIEHIDKNKTNNELNNLKLVINSENKLNNISTKIDVENNDFINNNVKKIYDSNGIKHGINKNSDTSLQDFDDEIWYELDGNLNGVFLSNYGKYYTNKVNKSYGSWVHNRYVFYKRFNNSNTKSFLIDEQLLIKLIGPRPSNSYEVCHIDGNNKNNHINNLKWIDKKDKDYTNIVNKTKSMSIFQIEKNKIINQFDSAKNASINLNINLGQISDCAKSKRLSAKSYQFIYQKDLYDPDLPDEEWKKHPTLNILVSNMGRIILQNGKTQGEYDITKNSYKSSYLKKYIHTIIAETFIENFDNYNEIDHINGNCNDNRVINLRWCNRKQQNLNRGHKYDNDFDNTDYIKQNVEILFNDKNLSFYQNILDNILTKYKNINEYLLSLYKHDDNNK